MDFKVGDIVKLKSGGPKMTIEKTGPLNSNNAETGIHCVWFVNIQGDEQLKDGKFVPETLIKPSNEK
jgi:uncharacterized protein YodC (DUF2158 family)